MWVAGSSITPPEAKALRTAKARSAVAVAALPAGALVEIEAWAHRPTPDRERSAANPA